MLRAVAIALILSFAVAARAQGVPPPPVPQLPDEPLPEWHPPPKTDPHSEAATLILAPVAASVAESTTSAHARATPERSLQRRVA